MTTINWETYKEKGNEEFKKKNYDSAITYYTDGISKKTFKKACDPSQEVLYSNRAQCYIYQKRYKFAIYDLNKCLDLNPQSIKALKRMAQIHLNLGNYGECESYQQKCIIIEPKEYSHQSELQTTKFLIMKLEELMKNYNNKDYKVSENMAIDILAKSPDFTRIKIIVIESMINNVKIPEVMSFITTKVSNEEKNQTDDFNYYLAIACYYDSNYQKAKQIMNIVFKRNPENAKYKKLNDILQVIEIEKEKANEIFKKGDYSGAIEAYTKLLEIDSENKVFNALIISNRALCYQKLGKNIEALADINKSLSLNENYTKAFTRRGNIHYDLGNFEEARYDYEKVKTLEPQNSDIKKKIEECKRKEKEAKKKDYYKILGVSRDASLDQIKKAYKKLAPKYHPDKNNGGTEEEKKQAEKMFKEVNEAYQVLSDPKKKAMFDNGTDPNDPSGGADFSEGVDPSEIFKVFFGGGGGFGQGPESKMLNKKVRFNMRGGDPFGGFGFNSNSSRGSKRGGYGPFG